MRGSCGRWILSGRMATAAATPAAAARRSSRQRTRSAPLQAKTAEVAVQRRRGPELDTVAARWQLALDAADRALGAARGSLPPGELVRRRGNLQRERRETADLLVRVARAAGTEPLPWLSPVPFSMQMLGLPTGVRGCLFDLEGVLTDGALLQAWAWNEVLESFLHRLTETTGWRFAPFDPASDYHAYLDGRPRLDGLHAFLLSRGIHLPEGDPDDPIDAHTVHGLANRKGDVLARRLRPRGVTALPGARAYVDAVGHAGLGRAVISASTSTRSMLELAGLATLIEERVDADAIRAEGLRPRPAPDLLIAACGRLGLDTRRAVTFTHSEAGVAAGRAAGLLVVGVGEGVTGGLLASAGARCVVPSVATLLDPRLAELATPSRPRRSR